MEQFVYHWSTKEITEKKNYHTEIRLYCIDNQGQTSCVRVVDCKTRLLVEFLDESYLEKNFWFIKSEFESKIYNTEDKKSIRKVYKRKLYGCNIGKDGKVVEFPFVEILFSSRIGMMSFKKQMNVFEKFPCKLKFHETEASSELQLLAETKINACGWFKISHFLLVKNYEKETSCCTEYITEKRYLQPCAKNDPVDIKVLAWDIEAKCTDISKNPGKHIMDCVFQISAVFFNCISKIRKKYLLTLGDCDKFADDVLILKYPNEKSLILGFSKLVSSEKPHIMTGWNIYKFDIEFLIARAERHMCLEEFCTYGFSDDVSEIKTLKWYSSANGTTEVKYIDSEGILSIDLLEVIRKKYKLSSYSLNNVSKHFLKDKVKDDVSFEFLMSAYTSYINSSPSCSSNFSKVGKYCVQDSELVLDLFDKLEVWLGLAEMAKTTNTSVLSINLNGQQKRVYNQVYCYTYNLNIVINAEDFPKTEGSCTGAFVIDPIPGNYSYVLPFDFASLYPSIIIAYNLDYTTFILNNENEFLPEESIETIAWEDHVYCDHDPLVIEKNRIKNLLENCFVKEKKKVLEKKLKNVVKKIGKGKVCQKKIFHFLKKEYYGAGVLPTIIKNLLDARKEVRKQIKTLAEKPGNESIIAVLEERQSSYKIAANSMYGATGVKSGALPCLAIAMCVTSIGRKSIKKAASLIKNLGGKIVYGDTDSNYVTFETKTEDHVLKCKELWEKSVEVAKYVSAEYPDPMKIEFEDKIYKKFMILTKKRYMYISCDKNGVESPKIGQKGVLLVRRDTSKFMKNVYEKTVLEVFNGKDKFQTIGSIINDILNLMTFCIDFKDLTITKTVNDYNNKQVIFDDLSRRYYMGNYIMPDPKEEIQDVQAFFESRLPAQVQLEIKLLGRGDERPEGSRIEYIVLSKKKKIKQSEKIEDYKYFCKNKSCLRVDYEYYIDKLIDPIEQIFDSVYGTENFVKKNVNQVLLKNKVVNEIRELFSPKF